MKTANSVVFPRTARICALQIRHASRLTIDNPSPRPTQCAESRTYTARSPRSDASCPRPRPAAPHWPVHATCVPTGLTWRRRNRFFAMRWSLATQWVQCRYSRVDLHARASTLSSGHWTRRSLHCQGCLRKFTAGQPQIKGGAPGTFDGVVVFGSLSLRCFQDLLSPAI